ncbi:MAG TPA: TlpA disulfide reductase family protein [Solirubrobacteraceae bacterium]|nr:TlpA disulfide reductase family protein [Solirubrobacteraceae bacterium]
MRRIAIPALIVAVAAALLALLGFGVAHLGSNSSIDASVARGDYPTAPNSGLQLPILGGSGSRSLAEFRGKVVVVNVFASWCPPCLAEAPMLEREEQQIAKDNATILGVTYQDNSSDSESFVQQHHISYPVVRDVTGKFSRAYGVNGVPETFVINRQGKIVALNRSQLDETWLKKTLPKILAEPS